MKKQTRKISAIIMAIIAIVIAFDLLPFDLNKPDLSKDNQVKLVKCIDGDTAVFSKIGKTRFLMIDTPENTNRVEKYGPEAAKFTCDSLKNAKVINYEFDVEKKDRYDRTLAWIFVDGELLQELIAKEGYIKKFYIYRNDYKYERRVKASVNDKYNLLKKGDKR